MFTAGVDGAARPDRGGAGRGRVSAVAAPSALSVAPYANHGPAVLPGLGNGYGTRPEVRRPLQLPQAGKRNGMGGPIGIDDIYLIQMPVDAENSEFIVVGQRGISEIQIIGNRIHRLR